MRALPIAIACAMLALVAVQPASAAGRPPHFWRTAAQAVAIADHQPAIRRLAAHDPSLRGQARVADLGLWLVTYRDAPRVEARGQGGDPPGDGPRPSPHPHP